MLKNDNFIFSPWICSPDVPHTFIKKRTGHRFFFFLNAISKSSTLAISELINQLRCPQHSSRGFETFPCFDQDRTCVFQPERSQLGL